MSTSVSTVQGSSGSPGGQTPATNSLGKDDFLKLLIAQMSNQDPLNPSDSTTWVTQLAQYSEVEQMTSVNSNLQSLILAQSSGNQTAATSLVGKDVSFRSSQLTLAGGQAVPISGTLTADVASVSAQISDASGRVVRTLRSGAAAAGSFRASWDGKDDAGNSLPDGTYSIALAGQDAQGNAVDVLSQGSGRVTGVSYASGSARLIVGGNLVSLADVIEVDQPQN
jgi:flagellar basal-body rod modification protein FlgD